MRFLVSAGEASSDMYAAGVTAHLAQTFPGIELYGCAGPKLQAAGVQPIVDASRLAIVGLAEVVSHLPGIYGEYRKLVRYAQEHPPDAALLTDSPDFHLRLARQLKRLDVPVFYLVAPQVWAWRTGRVRIIRQLVDKLFCLFPFEERWFRERGVDATYIGHPLATLVRPALTRPAFFERHEIPSGTPLLTLLPGSRPGEAVRHIPDLLEAVAILRRRFHLSIVLATPKGFGTSAALYSFREPLARLAIKVVENETWDVIAHADLALAASGTVTIEAAILGTPIVTFYKVNPLSWHAGRRLVKVPFLSMVNLIAGRLIVPELIQDRMTAGTLASEAASLLENPDEANEMRQNLAAVRQSLTAEGDPLARAARLISESLRSVSRPYGTAL